MLRTVSFRRGTRHAAVLGVTFVAFGAAFGAVAVAAGFSPGLAVASSAVILSGAGQFAVVGLLPQGPVAVLVAATGLALRHVPMSATLARLFPPLPAWRRLLLAYVLVDETFGLTVGAAAHGEPDLVAYKTGADVVLLTGWLGGTALGAALGSRIDVEILDALFPLLFLGLAAPLVRGRRAWVTAAAAVAAALLAVPLLPAAWEVTGAAVAAALVGSRVRA